MEVSSTEEVTQTTMIACSSYNHPCDFLQQAIRNFLKCLGLDPTSQVSPNQEDDKTNQTTFQDPTSTTEEAVDPSSTSTEQASKTNEDVAGNTISVSASTRPRRPPISPGGSPQIN